MNRVTDRATIVPEHLMVYYGTDGSLNERRSIDFAQSPAAAVNAWVASQPVTSLATPLSQEAPYLDVLPKTHSITLSGDDAVAFRLLQKLADQHTANAGNVETVISTQSGTVGLTAMEDPLALNVLNAPIKGPFAFELTVDPEKAKNLDLPPLSIAISPEKNAVTLTGVDADGEQHTRNLTLDNPDDVVAAFDELLKNYAKLEAENEAE